MTNDTGSDKALKEATDEMVRLCNQHRKLRQQLVSACGCSLMTQAGFSEGDEFTQQDEMRWRCLEPMWDVIEDLAAQMLKTKQEHDEQLALLNKMRQAQAKENAQ